MSLYTKFNYIKVLLKTAYAEEQNIEEKLSTPRNTIEEVQLLINKFIKLSGTDMPELIMKVQKIMIEEAQRKEMVKKSLEEFYDFLEIDATKRIALDVLRQSEGGLKAGLKCEEVIFHEFLKILSLELSAFGNNIFVRTDELGKRWALFKFLQAKKQEFHTDGMVRDAVRLQQVWELELGFYNTLGVTENLNEFANDDDLFIEMSAIIRDNSVSYCDKLALLGSLNYIEIKRLQNELAELKPIFIKGCDKIEFYTEMKEFKSISEYKIFYQSFQLMLKDLPETIPIHLLLT